MFKAICRTLLRIIATYIGVLVCTASTYLALYLFQYELSVYLWLDFYFMTVAIVIQILLLMSATSFLTGVVWFLTKKSFHLFSSLYYNFGIGFLFSLIYLIALGLSKNVESLYSIWFGFVMLPVIVFVPLVYIDYLLLYKRRRK